MSSVEGIRINDVFPVNDKELGLEIKNINRDANVTNQSGYWANIFERNSIKAGQLLQCSPRLGTKY